MKATETETEQSLKLRDAYDSLIAASVHLSKLDLSRLTIGEIEALVEVIFKMQSARRSIKAVYTDIISEGLE